jgi:hypothetical protein
LNTTKVLSGQAIEVTANVTNTGDVELTGLTAVDTEAGALDCDATTLAAGASTECTGTFNPTDSGTNTVTATANHQLGSVSDTDSEDFTVINPSIDVEKTCESTESTAPGVITWVITTTNTGDVSLDVNVTDTRHGTTFLSTLAPSESNVTTIVESGLDAGNYTDVATASGEHQLGTVEDTDSATCEIVANPEYTFDKDAVETEVDAGDTIHYNFVVVNTGDVALDISSIDLSDTGIDLGSLVGPVEGGTQDGVLQPDENATWTGTHVTTADDCPEYPNTATVSGIKFGDEELPPQEDSDSVIVNCPAVTRTLGYWATHLTQANEVWNNDVPDEFKNWCTDFSVDTTGKVMGGFWSSISRESDGDRRSSLDQARMQLAQQLIGAILNNAAFGSSPEGTTIEQAIDAFCGTDRAAILDAAGDMGAFNESGDNLPFPDGFVNSAATPSASKAAASKSFWDQPSLAGPA